MADFVQSLFCLENVILSLFVAKCYM